MTTDVSLIPQNRVENLITDLASKQSSSTAVISVNNITPVNGNVSLTLPQVDQTYNSNSSNAQSGSAINGLDSTLVHKSGDETISGNKTLNYDGYYKIKSSTMDVVDEPAPSSAKSIGFNFVDKDDDIHGQLFLRVDTNGSLRQSLACKSHTTNSWGELSIGFDSNDNVYTICPTPSTTDNSTKIATTAFVKTLGYVPNYSTQLSISLPYTAPANGFVSGVLTAAHSENYYLVVNNIQVQRIYGETNQRVTGPFFIPVYKGDVITTTGGTNTVYFYYAR